MARRFKGLTIDLGRLEFLDRPNDALPASDALRVADYDRSINAHCRMDRRAGAMLIDRRLGATVDILLVDPVSILRKNFRR